MKKSIAALALVGSISFFGAIPANALPTDDLTYNSGTISELGTTSDGTVAPGETFTFSGSGFAAGEAITITVTLSGASQGLQTLNTTADANGNFAFQLSIGSAGTYSLLATGASGKAVGPVSVTVAGAAVGTGTDTALANSGTALANTGADASLILWSLVGAGALAAGATSVVVVRRRAKAAA